MISGYQIGFDLDPSRFHLSGGLALFASRNDLGFFLALFVDCGHLCCLWRESPCVLFDQDFYLFWNRVGRRPVDDLEKIVVQASASLEFFHGASRGFVSARVSLCVPNQKYIEREKLGRSLTISDYEMGLTWIR